MYPAGKDTPKCHYPRDPSTTATLLPARDDVQIRKTPIPHTDYAIVRNRAPFTKGASTRDIWIKKGLCEHSPNFWLGVKSRRAVARPTDYLTVDYSASSEGVSSSLAGASSLAAGAAPFFFLPITMTNTTTMAMTATTATMIPTMVAVDNT